MDREYWFKKTEKKFLHNIDTFYYSVKLHDDFTKDASAYNVERLRRCITKYTSYPDASPFVETHYESPVLYKKGTYAFFYNFRLEVPEQFDFFFAPVVPDGAETVASVTSEIVVQIRSRLLWDYGAKLAFDKSFEFVKDFCETFELSISEVKENRCDFCWHTNALQDPESYLRIDNFSEMQVSSYRRVRYEYELKAKGFESDYIALGKRGQKVFVRMYLKTKEVVENGYKGWFFYYWYLNGLISAYDLYVLERAYENKKWSYSNIARLKFALENDDTLPEMSRRRMQQLLHAAEAGKPDYAAIESLADQFTPKLTKILNVEFQVMRKMTKTFILPEKNKDSGVVSRIYDFLDARPAITEYLTRKTLRLVRPGADGNKSRADYTDFWKRLRGTKQIDVRNKKQIKLVRDYSSKLDLRVRRMKAAKAVSAYSITLTKDPTRSIYEDTAELLACLNDNDMQKLNRYKYKYYKSIRSDDEFDDALIDFTKQRHIKIVDEVGEIYADS